MSLSNKIAYIVDLSSIDSIIACEYLYYNVKDRLINIVLHSTPKTQQELDNLNKLQSTFHKMQVLGNTGIIPEITEYLQTSVKDIFCGAPYTKLAHSIRYNQYAIRNLIGLGGYYEKGELYKQFQPKESYIFSQDLEAIETILTIDDAITLFVDIPKIKQIYLYGENVTNSIENTPKGLYWKNKDELAEALFKKYQIQEKNVILQSLFMVKDGLAQHYETKYRRRTLSLPDRTYIYNPETQQVIQPQRMCNLAENMTADDS